LDQVPIPRVVFLRELPISILQVHHRSLQDSSREVPVSVPYLITLLKSVSLRVALPGELPIPMEVPLVGSSAILLRKQWRNDLKFLVVFLRAHHQSLCFSSMEFSTLKIVLLSELAQVDFIGSLRELPIPLEVPTQNLEIVPSRELPVSMGAPTLAVIFIFRLH
jgi:hypothetical protein